MNDLDEIYDVLESYKKSFELIFDRLGAIDERQSKLESMLFDDIINPAMEAQAAADKGDRFDDFYSRNGERLDAYDAPLKSIERDDEFSLAKQAFDDYDALPEPKPDEAEYVDGLVEKVEAQINEIKASLGLPADADVTVEQDGDTGEVEVIADGENVTDEVIAEEGGEEEVTPAEEGTEEAAEEVTEEPALDENGEPVSDEEDLKALYEELEKAL